ncbi:MAG TPA: hypothetical protein PLR37_04100 [Candidatus Accumulibacter phosphatis]|nr:hypothetical protein [Candidatus Accumulibacter phosphatis]
MTAFAHLSLLQLIEGASDEEVEVLLPDVEYATDISNWYAVDYAKKRKRRRLMRDAYLALARGRGEAMRKKLLERLEAAMLAGLTYGLQKQPRRTRSLRPGV